MARAKNNSGVIFKLQPRVAKFRRQAEALEGQIEYKRRPMTQNATPKRLREYYQRLHDAEDMDRVRRALLALAARIEMGTLPTELEHLDTKAQIAPLVHLKREYGGQGGTVQSLNEYTDESRAGKALQRLVDGDVTFSDLADQSERERLRRIEQMENEVRFTKIPGFFPTPDRVISDMIDVARVRPDHSCLEPSAGIGSIAEALRKHGVNTIACCEIRPSLRDILMEKQFIVLNEPDFLEYHPKTLYDRILMNPPFENLQDIDHVRHAYDCLAPGGILVSLMSPAPWFRNIKKAQEFREWLKTLAKVDVVELPSASFTGVESFRQTSVSIQRIKIEKWRD